MVRTSSQVSNTRVDIFCQRGAAVGRWSTQIQIIFRKEAFQEVVPWLMLNREGLDILVHPLSDDEYDDHTASALWLGTPVALKIETLPHGPYPKELLPAA